MKEITFQISRFNNKNDTTPRVEVWTWETLCSLATNPVIRKRKDGALFSPAFFNPAYRKKDNVVSVSLLVLDCDHCTDIESVVKRLQDLGLGFLTYTTHSHKRLTENNLHAEPCYRIVIPLLEPIPANLFDALWQWAATESGRLADEATKDSSRMFYLPSKYSEEAEYEFRIYEGNPLDCRALNLQPTIEKAKREKSKKAATTAGANSSSPITVEDDELLSLARQRFGAKFERLYSGDSSDYPKKNKKNGEPDVSDADEGFVVRLCYAGATDEQIERIWKASPRNRAKLYEHVTYVPMTIDSAREWIANKQEAIDISCLEEIEDDDPPISDNRDREKFLRKVPNNHRLLSDTYAIYLRQLGFEEKGNTRILTALTQLGGAKTCTFRATTDQLQKKYAGVGKAASLSSVKRDKERLLKEQWRLDVALIGYRSFPYNPESQNCPPSEFQNHLLRKSLEAINIVLEENPKDKFIDRAKLEEACKRLLPEFPKPLERITKKKGPAKTKKSEMDKTTAKFSKVLDELLEQKRKAGLDVQTVENWVSTFVQARVNVKLKASANMAHFEPYSEVQNPSLSQPEIKPDLEVFSIQ